MLFSVEADGVDVSGIAMNGESDSFRIPRQNLIDVFHMYFADNLRSHVGPPMNYKGVPIHKHPCDLFNYQQIIFEQQPDFVVECGAFQGGATLYFANTLDIIGKGRVISVDICEREGVWHETVRQHPRVTCIAGSSTDPDVVNQVHDLIGASRNNFVILDSLHTKAHVLGELAAYADLLGAGNYLIVEDSNLNGHPLPPEMHPGTMETGGPFEAVEEFMKGNEEFYIDSEMERRFLFSFAPSGYIVKK